ncbi:MAG: chromosomal replication initiator protein DnaA [Clostridia bacterium]|nr:chromosomal replication initiator protein DnaA [Clostridia bacterium]
MDIYEVIWSGVLSYLKENTNEMVYNTWITPLKINNIDDDLKIAYLEVNIDKNEDLVLNVIKTRFIEYLEKGFALIMGAAYRVVVKKSSEYGTSVKKDSSQVEMNIETEKKKVAPLKKVEVNELIKEKLFNPSYTFDNFVVGPSNQFAYSVAKAVAGSPSETYNPVFIYGGSGLGKTHLLHSIGIELLTNRPELNVLYVSSEMFTNEFITALQNNKLMSSFKNKYRMIDVLLIDDIQFLEGKEQIQNEFFYTFEHLYNMNKQIILSSDKQPDKLVNLDKRLTSRFSWNMVADISSPDFETRVAILNKKAENECIELDDDIREVINLIAEKMKDNIRELEGAFSRIIGFSKIMNQKIDRHFARKVLTDILSNTESQVTPERIKKMVAKKYTIKASDMESTKRTANIAYPRQIAMYLVRELTDNSLPQIGKIFGNRHHTTVSYACEKIESDMKYDENLKNIINKLKSDIKDN